ncbi:MAG: NADH-quinone oxidoreductase subunit C [Candidatus Kapaibacterium sp.]
MEKQHEKFIEIARNYDSDVETKVHRGQLTIKTRPEKLIDILNGLRDNPESSFDMLIDITAIDWNRRGERFEVVYFLYSNKLKHRVRIKIGADAKSPKCPTITALWDSADWYEREVYDMFGIIFEGHPRFRRFYMPEDFNDPETGDPLYPMRKEFPLMGIPDSLPLPAYPERYGDLTDE